MMMMLKISLVLVSLVPLTWARDGYLRKGKEFDGSVFSNKVVEEERHLQSTDRDVAFLIDGSGSIDASDWTLQKEGVVTAINDIVPTDGTVALSVVQFSTPNPILEFPLTVIDSVSARDAVVAAVNGMSQIGDLTNPGDGMNVATTHLASTYRATAEQSFCLMTDGVVNSGTDVATAVNAAKASSFALDSFGVVAIEDPPENDEDDFVDEYGPHVFGGGAVNVVANTVEFANTVGAVCFSGEAKLVGLEVTQVSQDLQNTVTLVEGKTTLVRAYLEPLDATPVRLQARLRGRRGGTELPLSPLTAINPGGAIRASPNAKDRRDILDDSLNFLLPADWTSGVVELELEAFGALVCEEQAGPVANDCKAEVEFETTAEMEVKLVTVTYRDVATGNIVASDGSDLTELRDRLLAMAPTPSIDMTTGAVDMGNVTNGPDGSDILSELTAMRALDSAGNRLYYGAVDQTGRLYWGTSRIGGLGRLNGDVACGRIADGTSYGRNRHFHEMGHNAGFQHSVNTDITNPDGSTERKGPCGSKAPTGTPDFPFIETVGGVQRPTLGPLSPEDERVYGWDSDRDIVLDPEETFELMSYCGDERWPSSHTYERFRNFIVRDFRRDMQPAAPHKIVPAKVNLNTMLVERWYSAYDTTYIEGLNDGTKTLKLKLEDSLGQSLEEFDVSLEEMLVDIEEGGDLGTENYALVNVPILKEKIDSVSVIKLAKTDGTEIGSESVSQNPPTVQVAYPKAGDTLSGDVVTSEWSGSDPDGDLVDYFVRYSMDGGVTWKSLGVGISSTSLDVPISALGGTTDGRLQVQASDGVLTAEATSGPFTVPDSPPEVRITSPPDNSLFSGTQLIGLQAAFFDVEDGQSGDVSWNSDKNGVLGTGPSLDLTANVLDAGAHEITVVGRDSSGNSDSDTITINVLRIAGTNTPPIVDCKDVTVSAGADCTADADIKDGFATDVEDGDESNLDLVYNPEGPYGIGNTLVRLTVTDTGDLATSCEGTVTVEDVTPPDDVPCPKDSISPSDVSMTRPVEFSLTTADNCDDNPKVVVTGVDCVKYTGNGKPQESNCKVDYAGNTVSISISGGVGTEINVRAQATDNSGNSRETTCTVEVV